MPKHPIQPVEIDDQGTLRFKENAIVCYLLDAGPFDPNHLARLAAGGRFTREDQEQFAQLIGYSLSGAADLSYFSNQTYEAADKMARDGIDEKDARIASLEAVLATVREGLKIAAPAVFRIHPDDLTDTEST